MAKKTDGITELTKCMVICAGKLNKSEYKKLTSVVYAVLNGVTYQYPHFGPEFLRDAEDIRSVHKNDKNGKDNVVRLKLIQGTGDVNNLL